jgi:hypothetical protein
MKVGELKESLKPNLRVREKATTDVLGQAVSKVPPVIAPPILGDPFVIEGEKGGLYLTAPANVLAAPQAAEWEHAASANPNYLYLQGRFVEADNPNRNNAFWTTPDLELAQATVTNGPLNWLHDEKHIIGTLTDSKMVYRENADEVGNHISAMSAVWRFIYPQEADIIEKASEAHTLWYSMECVADSVTCIDGPGKPGCGETFNYQTVQREPAKVCSHLRERSSIRRFNQPTFLGGAVIIPPVRPGWADASAGVMRQAAQVTEKNHLTDILDRADAERMVAMVIQYANGEL